MKRTFEYRRLEIAKISLLLFCLSLLFSSCSISKKIIGKWTIAKITSPNGSEEDVNKKWISFEKNNKVYGGRLPNDTTRTGTWEIDKKSKAISITTDKSTMIDRMKIQEISKSKILLKGKENQIIELKKN